MKNKEFEKGREYERELTSLKFYLFIGITLLFLGISYFCIFLLYNTYLLESIILILFGGMALYIWYFDKKNLERDKRIL